MSSIHLLVVVVVLTVLDSLASVTACSKPTDVKARLVNGGKSIEFSWKPPTTGPSVSRYRFTINKNWNGTTGLKYQIQTPQIGTTYIFDIQSKCESGTDSTYERVTIGPCQPPVDVKAALVNNGKGIEFSWKQPNTDLTNDNYYVYINGQRNTTNELKYSINKPQLGTLYTFDVGRVCSNGGDSVRVTAQIGYIGKAVYATAGQSVNLGWTTTATIIETIDIKRADGEKGIILLRKNNAAIYAQFQERVVYTGDLANSRISFELNDVTKYDAGYYMSETGTTDRGGQVLVILDKPTKPRITGGEPSYVGKHVQLSCDSTKTSRPGYYTPILNFTWLINDSLYVNNPTFLKGRYIQRKNTLTVHNITKEDGDNSISCLATDRGQVSKQSESVVIDPYFGPEKVNLIPIMTVQVGKPFGPITCMAECNPPCNFKWIFGQAATQRTYTNSDTLYIHRMNAAHNGQYSCLARSPNPSVLQVERTKTINLNTQLITNVTFSTNGSKPALLDTLLTVSENNDVHLQCNIAGDSKARLSWNRNNKTLVERSSDKSIDYNLGPSISCETSGEYFCLADDGLSVAVTRSTNLRVQCKPKQNAYSPASTYYGSRLNAVVNAGLSIIAFPKPNHEWRSNTTGQITEKPTVSMNFYTHHYEVSVKIRSVTDFGKYCLDAINSLGSTHICFQIKAAGHPVEPTHFALLDVSHDAIKVTWISEFNGGRDQMFYLEYHARDDISDFTRINVSDRGLGEEIRLSIRKLKADTIYTLKLYSGNVFGNSSLQVLEVKTKLNQFNSIWIGVIAGIVIILAAAVLVIFVLFRKRPNCKPKKEDPQQNVELLKLNDNVATAATRQTCITTTTQPRRDEKQNDQPHAYESIPEEQNTYDYAQGELTQQYLDIDISNTRRKVKSGDEQHEHCKGSQAINAYDDVQQTEAVQQYVQMNEHQGDVRGSQAINAYDDVQQTEAAQQYVQMNEHHEEVRGSQAINIYDDLQQTEAAQQYTQMSKYANTGQM